MGWIAEAPAHPLNNKLYLTPRIALKLPPLGGDKMARTPSPKAPARSPKAPTDTSKTTKRRRADPMEVPAVYVTMTSLMATKNALRISFGESYPDSAKYHLAIAMDFDVADALRGALERVVKRHKEGKVKSEVVVEEDNG